MADQKVWNEWVSKEFIHTMRQKNKMDTPTSYARDRKISEQCGTMGRVFPQRQDAIKATGGQGGKQATAGGAHKHGGSAERQKLKERITSLQQEMDEERTKREHMQAELEMST
mmetsp:Transcript_29827/g.41240  ORF Transcript_29827/g.41240 Transcript_29827/m.41240 type:complete len:113 (-) Transcript_29827:73-411(-)|eukprot:CAMPEP_0196589312 /NCGR_PEP_ID=MMETSP1081-20130531/63253_1 /TAXON_ID=36882 /ORGANISM="Pyramimonas amylifera, Strain CCMP720" /LENGTH=112 /DNA_ID=CAMNT_0041912077 /DNA_START=156 /DNA_END=494 /DNA_ORIENTATION=+